MSTLKQHAANRRNSQLSTGPRTAQGKAHSAQNALKHGLTAQHLVIPSESPDEFNELATALRQEHDPQSATQQILVDQIIDAAWKLRRLRQFETRFYTELSTKWDKDYGKGLEHQAMEVFTGRTNTLETLARHQARLERSFYRALSELKKLQNETIPADPVSADLSADLQTPPVRVGKQMQQNEPISDLTPEESTPAPQPTPARPDEPEPLAA